MEKLIVRIKGILRRCAKFSGKKKLQGMARHYALLIGSNGKSNSLEFAESDVVRLKNWLETDSAWRQNSSEDDIRTVLGSKPRFGKKKQTTSAYLLEQIDKFIKEKGSSADTVLFLSFSGHASVIENDIPTFHFEGSDIPFQTIFDKCIKVQSPANIFLLLDCCNTIDEAKQQAGKKSFIEVVSAIFQVLNRKENVINAKGERTTIFASSPGTSAYESSLVGGSIFLSEFMAVCSSGGNSSNVIEHMNGIIRVKYVTEFISQELAGIQQPQFFGYDFPIKKLYSLDTRPTDVDQFVLLHDKGIAYPDKDIIFPDKDIVVNSHLPEIFSIPLKISSEEPILSIDVYQNQSAALQIIAGETDGKLSYASLGFLPNKKPSANIRSFQIDSGDPGDICYLAGEGNSQYIAVNNGIDTLTIYNAEEPHHQVYNTQLAGRMILSYNHTRLAMITRDKQCIIMSTDSASYQAKQSLQQKLLVENAVSAAFSPHCFFVSTKNGDIKQFSLKPANWQIADNAAILPAIRKDFSALRIVVDQNEEVAAAICSNNGNSGFIGVWPLKAREISNTISVEPYNSSAFKEIALSPDGNWLVAINDTHVIAAQKAENKFIYHVQFVKPLSEFIDSSGSPKEIFTCLAFAPELFILPCVAVGTNYGAVYIWDFLNENMQLVQQRNNCFIFRLIFTGINHFTAWLTAATGKSVSVYSITPHKKQ